MLNSRTAADIPAKRRFDLAESKQQHTGLTADNCTDTSKRELNKRLQKTFHPPYPNRLVE